MKVNLNLLHICNEIGIMSRVLVVENSIMRNDISCTVVIYLKDNVRGEIPQVKSLRLSKYVTKRETFIYY